MISSRHALPAVIILAMALVPTIIHSYMGMKVDDGMSATGISQVLGDFTSQATKRKAQWVKEIFASQDWFERIYSDPRSSRIRLFVIRSYDHKRLYHHPELALSYGKGLEKGGVTQLPGLSGIPVYLLRSKKGPGLVAYALLYDGDFIDNPIFHQVKNSVNLLFNARRPMTLFYASDPNAPGNSKFENSTISSLLANAIQSFNAQR